MTVEKIVVELGERSYEVTIGVGLLGSIDKVLGDLVRERRWRKAAIITDDNVGALYAGLVSTGLGRAGLRTATFSVEAGEKSKSMESALRVIDFLAVEDITRSDVVVAPGGGVVGDLAGFAASVFKRGIDLVQLPTTLMSQVDSAIGGKTAVNLDTGKNLLGSFHQPAAVFSDIGALESLPPREYSSGMAEVAKYTFLRPGAFGAGGALKRLAGRDPSELLPVVAACARIKAEVVSVDERDTGIRAILNYGHTLGHALEAATEYEGSYTHGSAVSVGMVFAALVSEAIGLASEGLAERHRQALGGVGLPVAPFPPAPRFETLAPFMARDKKNRGVTTMVLLEEEGSAAVRAGLDPEVLASSYDRMVEVD